MIQRLLLPSLFAILLLGCNKDDTPVDITTPTVNSKPNILLIIADDMGIEATPGYNIGSVKPDMPNLQSLASKGITFQNVWAYPICSPTRSSILTGKYGYRTGVLNATDASTIPATEKTVHSFLDEKTNSVYSHSIIGKWHLSNNEPNRPIEMGIGYYAGLLSGATPDYNEWSLTENGSTSTFDGYITTKISDLAIDWIGEQSGPWFCWLAYTSPHTPFHVPPAGTHSQGDLSSDEASIEANPMPYFMAMMENLDFEIGRVLESIPADELENTTIIFIGDNGSHNKVLQSPYESGQGKGSLFQGGVHVPMIVSGKGVTRTNAEDNNLISSTDLFSTIAELAGAELSTYEDSYSFKSLLTSESKGSRTHNYSEVLGTNDNKSGYTIRNTKFKLMVFNNGRRSFYDLANDPYEKTNLIQANLTEEQQSALDELDSKADEIRQ